jgi:hypothetical protein
VPLVKLARADAEAARYDGWVTEYIVNPRRAPRAPSRCATQVRAGAAAFAAETEDIGPSGCQLVAPGALARGQAVALVFANPKVQGALSVEGKVAWGSSRPPWRVGVAFGDECRADAERWFQQLVAAHPGMGGFRRVPDRLPLDAMIFLAAPPSFLFDFSPDEVEVLRHVASGTTIAALRNRLEASWSLSQRALFGLMARGMVTVNRGAASHPSAWKKVMAELGAEFVHDVPRATRAPPLLERPAVRGTASLRTDADGALEFDLESSAPPPPRPPPPAPHAVAPVTAASAPVAEPGGATGGPTAGTGWRGEARTRSREAQECLDLGRGESVAGRTQSAMAHLRRALQLAPGDAEIAAELGRAMTGPPSR